MSDLYIKLENGKPVGHPFAGDNLRTTFPDIDLENLGTEWARFQRNPPPLYFSVYEEVEGPTYEFDEAGVVHDIWVVKPISEEAKLAKQNQVKQHWLDHPDLGYKSWVFDEENCRFVAPIPLPADADTKPYVWNEETQSFDEVVLPDQTTPIIPP